MGILAWLVIGLVAGVLAKMVVPGERPGGFIGDIVIGVVGAFIGGFIFHLFGHSGITGFNVYSTIVAFVGAVVLLFVVRILTGRRATF